MKEIPNNWSIEKWEENLEEAQDLFDNRYNELQLATRVKIEQALGKRDEPTEEQKKLFNKRLLGLK